MTEIDQWLVLNIDIKSCNGSMVIQGPFSNIKVYLLECFVVVFLKVVTFTLYYIWKKILYFWFTWFLLRMMLLFMHTYVKYIFFYNAPWCFCFKVVCSMSWETLSENRQNCAIVKVLIAHQQKQNNTGNKLTQLWPINQSHKQWNSCS